MKCVFGLALAATLVSTACRSDTEVQFPMRNDPNFTTKVEKPSFETENGPLIVIDEGHNNFFITTDLIQPLLELLKSDGYRIDFSRGQLDSAALDQADIFLVITPMSSAYTDFEENYSEAYLSEELAVLERWVREGGSLIVFSEHFPFDIAVSGLLETFGISTSIGVTIDHDFSNESAGEIVFEGERLDKRHPIVAGKRSVKKVASYGGSALRGDGYTNIMQLSDHSMNISRNWMGVEGGPLGRGNSQGLAGFYGDGRIAAFGDSNGFAAMIFEDNISKDFVGMNDEAYDWRNLVLNTFDWLSGS